jgi:sulfatase modifying factor 1
MTERARPPAHQLEGMVPIPEGTFRMGSAEHYPEEAPVNRVNIGAFWVRSTAVTNSHYAVFIDDTGYVTVAERPLDPADFPGAPAENLVAGSLVFTMTPGPVDLSHMSQWWTWTPGASWHQPEGPGSSVERRRDHPVVHVAFEDALAYAEWAGEDLPTEGEWEYAARAGADGKAFVWGDDAVPGGQYLANFWQGDFPWRNNEADGFAGTAPVGSYPPNDFGLYDMAGNVWEWTTDWYADAHPADAESACCVPTDPRGPSIESSFDPGQPQFSIPRRVIKGGSFLCADNYCQRYRPAARRPQMIDTGMSHLGFRTVSRERELTRDE